MKLLRAATLTVADLDAAEALYRDFLDYTTVSRGTLGADLAEAFDAPKSAHARSLVMAPASGAEIYLRLVEQKPVPEYKPLTTYGWNSIEICVQDVLAAHERIKPSPFEVIGPPREIEGLPAIYPMQMKGPDGEIVYLTQIRDNLPAYDLPRATAPIDRLFILVIGCSDMHASLKWFDDTLGFETGRVMEIEYHMLADAFGTPRTELHTISTGIHGRDVFLELDQYPAAATERPQHEGMLVPGCCVGSFLHPDFDSIKGDWVSPPKVRDGAPYNGKRSGTLRGPDGLLVEVIEL
jgi:catechol 2,3-dioxygenase-like lactoylglutathione lyase family enzyme